MASYTSGPKQAARPDLVPSGEYDVRVMNAEEGVSEAGNDKIELKLEVIMPDDSPGPIVYDSLVFTASAGWKIDQFRAACGEVVVEGEEVDVNGDDYIDEVLRVKLVQEADRRERGKKRNKVGRYIEAPAGKEPPKKSAIADDDVPF